MDYSAISTNPKACYRATERIYLNTRGRVCGPKDPDAHHLLVAPGDTLTLNEARRYGLIAAEAEPGDIAPPFVAETPVLPPAQSVPVVVVHQVGDVSDTGASPKSTKTRRKSTRK